jgi:hypothetical protein
MYGVDVSAVALAVSSKGYKQLAGSHAAWSRIPFLAGFLGDLYGGAERGDQLIAPVHSLDDQGGIGRPISGIWMCVYSRDLDPIG